MMDAIGRREFLAGTCALAALAPHGRAFAKAETLTITGASTLAPLMQEIAQSYSAATGVRVDVQSGGTYRGIADVRRKLADVGMVSRELKPDEKDLGETLLGRDGVTLIVHARNKVALLDAEQIKAIYRGEITNWKQLGGADGTITVVNKADGRSTLDVFVAASGIPARDIKAQVVIGDNEQGIKVVSGNPRAIGYVSIGAAEYQIKAGAPLRMVGLGPVAPSIANVANGTYFAARELNLVHMREPSAAVAAFLSFAVLEKNHELVREYYFVPPGR